MRQQMKLLPPPEPGAPRRPVIMDDPRSRIYHAALQLFARKGFDGASVRDIARLARVNVAMISYYYGGKAAILQEIIETFFNRYAAMLQRALIDETGEFSDRLRTFIRELVALFREDPDLPMVAMTQIPYDMPLIDDFKAEKMRQLATAMSRVLPSAALDPRRMAMLGPCLIGAILAHFMVRPVLSKVFPLQYDDRYYEDLIETIAMTHLHGVLAAVPLCETGFPAEVAPEVAG